VDRNELIFVLALGTIALGLMWGLWQFFSVRRCQAKRGETPGVADATEEMLQHRQGGSQAGDLRPAKDARPPR